MAFKRCPKHVAVVLIRDPDKPPHLRCWVCDLLKPLEDRIAELEDTVFDLEMEAGI